MSESTCAVCRAPWSEDLDGWISLEVSRGTDVDDCCGSGWWHETFCSQEHAAQWLGQPLPEQPDEAPDSSWKAKLAGALGCAVLLLLLASLVVGLVTIVGGAVDLLR